MMKHTVDNAKRNDNAAVQILLEIAKKAQHAVMADLAEKEGSQQDNSRHKPTIEAVSRSISNLSKVNVSSKTPSKADLNNFFAKKN
jgi:hypothetical protein